MITKKVLLVALLFFMMAAIYAQPGRIDSFLIVQPAFHYQPEYTFDRPVDMPAWQKQKPGLHVAFGSTDEAYFRAEVPAVTEETKVFDATGWKGERMNAMILVWSPDTIGQIRFVLNDLKDEKGNKLGKDKLQLSMVRYVLSNYPYDEKDITCGEGPVDKAWLMPERLELFDRFELPAVHRQAFPLTSQ